MTPVLKIERLSRRFGGLKAVDDLSLSLAAGEVVALVGPNGSGKTTLLNLVSGALRPDGGAVWLEDRRLDTSTAPAICRAGIARTFQLVRVLEGMSVAENVMVAAMHGRLRVHPADARRLADDTLDRLGFQADRNRAAGSLTYIDQKRVELARALACGPKVLLLDEWLAGLNPTELQDGIASVRAVAASGVAVLLVEHVMAAVHALAGRCVVMCAGRVIADAAPAVALADPAVVTAYVGGHDAAA